MKKPSLTFGLLCSLFVAQFTYAAEYMKFISTKDIIGITAPAEFTPIKLAVEQELIEANIVVVDIALREKSLKEIAFSQTGATKTQLSAGNFYAANKMIVIGQSDKQIMFKLIDVKSGQLLTVWKSEDANSGIDKVLGGISKKIVGSDNNVTLFEDGSVMISNFSKGYVSSGRVAVFEDGSDRSLFIEGSSELSCFRLNADDKNAYGECFARTDEIVNTSKVYATIVSKQNDLRFYYKPNGMVCVGIKGAKMNCVGNK